MSSENGGGDRHAPVLLNDRLNLELLRHPYVRASGVLVALAAFVVVIGQFWSPGRELRFASYVTLHAFLETCSIIVCVLVFVTAYGGHDHRRNRNMVLLGVAFLGVAMLDFLHTQSDLGMPPLVTPSSPGKAINFWLAARLLAAGALLAAAFLSWERLLPSGHLSRWIGGMCGGVALTTWVFLYRPHWVPQTFIPGQGLTTFKICVEYVIITLSLIAAIGYYRLAGEPRVPSGAIARFNPVALLAATIVTAMAELFLTIYTDINGLFNVLGHIYKVIGAWFLYRGLVSTNLFEIEARAQLALDAAQLGSWSWDLGTDIIDWDEAGVSSWGLPKGARLTMSAVDALIHPDDRVAKQDALRRALDPTGDGAYVAEYRVVRSGDGGIRHVASRGKTEFQDGKPVRVIGIIRDITEHQLAENAVRQSEARLAAILSIAADAIISIDEQQRITLFNQGAEKIFGFSSAEVIGKPLDLLIPRRLHSTHARHLTAFRQGVQTSRKMGERAAIFGVRKDGTEFPAEASISRLDLPTGPVFTAILRDVTQTKLTAQRLETSVAERTRELRDEIQRREQAQAALSRAQRMEAFGQLAGGVAHDFNNLLTVISGNQELLEMRLKGDKELELLRRSQQAAAMGARLTGRLLTFARRRQLEPTVLDLNAQISGMTELVGRSIGEQVTLKTNLAPRLWAVRVDPSEIENAVLNLAINARDAMPNGGTIVVETAACSVGDGEIGRELKLSAGDYVRISVSDTGAGMPPEVIAHAFEPFYTTKAPGKGTGLGLSSIYGFVQQSGGTVTICSEVGLGTTINIYLPRVVEDRKADGSERSDGPVAGKGEAVLLVEDRPDVREVTRARLEQLGYGVIEAESGAVAIELLQSDKAIVQLVFSDIIMPGGVSGYDLARWVRANRPTLKVLLASGFAEQVAGTRDPDHATAKVLRKPYTRIDLARAVRDVLDN